MDETVVRMYIKESCPYCQMAKDKIIEEKKMSLHLVEVSNKPDIRDKIEKETGHKTVPAIYIGDEFIGGFSELQKLDEEGKLDPMLLKEEVRILRIENARVRRSV